MQLYSSPDSPFGTRIEIAARAKGISVDEVPLPAGGLRSPEFLALNPIAKIPLLLTDTGTILPESETILRYLERRFPKPSLYPTDADARARVDLAVRILDLYVMAPVIRLFAHLDPAVRDADVVVREVAAWRTGLAALAHFLGKPLADAPAGVSMADCALAPSLHLCTRIAAMLELEEDPLTAHGALVAYYRNMACHPLVGPALERVTVLQEAKDIKAGRRSLAAHHRHMAALAA